jgi:Rieske Fe-S protein
MPGEDQKRFEDYLELERYIEALQEGRVAHPPSDLTPTQARIYRAATLFRSASPGAATPRPEFVEELFTRLLALDQDDAATPRPEFVEELQARLLALDQEANDEDTLKMPRVKKAEEPAVVPLQVELETPTRAEQERPGEHMVAAQPAEIEAATREEREQSSEQEGVVPPVPVRKNTPRRASFFSRRSLLTGSAVAAASLVVGTGIGAMAERSATTPPASASHPATTPAPTGISPYSPSNPQMPLVPAGAGMWHYVGTLDEIRGNVRPFSTETIVGYVTISDGDEGEQKDEIIAMSAACTHMGCLVQWQESDHQFHCPCHDGVFTEYGKPSQSGKLKYLAPLPRMQTMKGDNGEVYVLVPKSPKSAT